MGQGPLADEEPDQGSEIQLELIVFTFELPQALVLGLVGSVLGVEPAAEARDVPLGVRNVEPVPMSPSRSVRPQPISISFQRSAVSMTELSEQEAATTVARPRTDCTNRERGTGRRQLDPTSETTVRRASGGPAAGAIG